MGIFGDSSRVCLLRAICETAEMPFEETHGLLGELLNVLLRPSSTLERHEVYEDHEYHRAESIGREYRGACGRIFYECTRSPLEHFTSL
uniref:Uncharacterized protein n=1 Tax=Bracon brevicornis TaxID=1563983 RepID=A0A6V7IHB8_9HYME